MNHAKKELIDINHKEKRFGIITLGFIFIALIITCAVYTYAINNEISYMPKVMQYESELFGDEIFSVNIIADDTTWQTILDNAMLEEYTPVDVEVNGILYKNVGFRPKGNSTLMRIAQDSTTDRFSFKIKFDEYVTGQMCMGLDLLILNNVMNDNTYLKDYVAYDIMDYIEADSLLYNYANMSLNGENIGLYTALEGYSNSFLSRTYGHANGYLYKVNSNSMDVGEEKTNSRVDNTSITDIINNITNIKASNIPDTEIVLLNNMGSPQQSNRQQGEIPQMGEQIQGGMPMMQETETTTENTTEAIINPKIEMQQGTQGNDRQQGEMPQMGGQMQGEMPQIGGQTQGEMPQMGGQMQGEMPQMGGQTQGEMPQMGGQTQGEMPQIGGQTQGEMPQMGEQTQGEMPQMGGQTQGEMPQIGGQTQGEMPQIGEQTQGEMPQIGGQTQGEMPQIGGQTQGEMPQMGEQTQGEMPQMGGQMQGGMVGNMISSSGGGGDFIYTDDNFESYSDILENSINNTSNYDDKKRVIQAIQALDEATTPEEIEAYWDVDSILKFFAGHTTVVNMDSFSAGRFTNLYVYEFNGKMNLIPWDYNESFAGAFATGVDLVNFPIDTPFINIDISDFPLFDKLLAIPEYKALYHIYLLDICDYIDNSLISKLNDLQEKINPLIESDPTAFVTYSNYLKGAEELKSALLLRSESIRGQVAGTIPSTTQSQAQNPDLLIKHSINTSTLGSNSGGMGGGGNGDRMQNMGGDRTQTNQNNQSGNMMGQMPNFDELGLDIEGLGLDKIQSIEDLANLPEDTINQLRGAMMGEMQGGNMPNMVGDMRENSMTSNSLNTQNIIILFGSLIVMFIAGLLIKKNII